MSTASPRPAHAGEAGPSVSLTNDHEVDPFPTRVKAAPVTVARVVRFEWVKIRTLRSNWIGFGAVLLILIAVGTIAAFTVDSGADDTDPIPVVLAGTSLAVLLVGIFGALHGAREFTSRMIVTTVAAVPRRWQVVVGKSVALLSMTLPVAVGGSFMAFLIGMGVLSANDATSLSLTDNGALGAVIGSAAWLGAVAILGMTLGIILRNVAASIGVIMGVLLIVPQLAESLLPDSWGTLLDFLPSNAAKSFTGTTSGDALPVAGGIIVVIAWTALALAAAALTLQRRDV